MTGRNEVRDAAAAASFRAASAVASFAPSLLAAGVPAVVGAPLSVAQRDRRAMVERHLRRVVPGLRGLALRRAVAESFQSYARYYVEMLRIASRSQDAIERGFTVEGFRHIEESHAAGRGTILALPHLGGWEWAGRWLAGRGFAVCAVAEALDNEPLFEWFTELRASIGIEVIPLDDSAATRVGSALRDNRVVCLLCDRDLPRDGRRTGVEVEFFGERTTVPSGPALFALRTGARLLPVGTYFTRRADGHHAVIRPPVDASRRGSLRDDVARTTQSLTRELEVLIRRAPSQWHLFQPNWPSDPGY